MLKFAVAIHAAFSMCCNSGVILDVWIWSACPSIQGKANVFLEKMFWSLLLIKLSRLEYFAAPLSATACSLEPNFRLQAYFLPRPAATGILEIIPAIYVLSWSHKAVARSQNHTSTLMKVTSSCLKDPRGFSLSVCMECLLFHELQRESAL